MSPISQIQLSQAFEHCADAIVNGDIQTLKTHIHQQPDLIHGRSERDHHATLLFYITANSVENERQITPDNILDITQFLLEQGADPNATCDAYGGNTTVLGSLVSSTHPARAGKQADLVKLLCQQGADPDINDSEPLKTAIAFRYAKAVEALVDCDASLNHIVFASAVGNLEAVKTYMQGDIQPFTTAFGVELHDKQEILEFALASASMMGQADIVRYLLEQGVNPNAKRSAEYGTALHEASIVGQIAIVELLLSHGADVTLQDKQGFTPLHWAAWHQRHDVMDSLLNHDAPLEALNNYGGTVLDSTIYGFIHSHYSVENPIPTLQKLLDAGADATFVSPFPTGHDAIDALLRPYREIE